MITVIDAARLLGVTPGRVRTLCRQGRIRGAKRIGYTWIMPNRVMVYQAARGPLPNFTKAQP
jgi:hypothetical protein